MKQSQNNTTFNLDFIERLTDELYRVSFKVKHKANKPKSFSFLTNFKIWWAEEDLADALVINHTYKFKETTTLSEKKQLLWHIGRKIEMKIMTGSLRPYKDIAHTHNLKNGMSCQEKSFVW